MLRYGIYDETTGDWTGIEVSVLDDSTAALNAPVGAVAKWCRDHPPHAYKMVNEKLELYVPPQPDADHEWDDGDKLWKLNAAAVQRKTDHHFAKKRIDELEVSQARAMREYVLDPNKKGTDGKDAKDRLTEIEAEIAAKRGQL